MIDFDKEYRLTFALYVAWTIQWNEGTHTLSFCPSGVHCREFSECFNLISFKVSNGKGI